MEWEVGCAGKKIETGSAMRREVIDRSDESGELLGWQDDAKFDCR